MSLELDVLTDRLIAALPSTGLRVLGRLWDEQAFGSGLTELGRSTAELRIVWDGKDSWAFLQKLLPDGKWVDIAGPVRKSDFGFGVLDERKVEEMADAARVALGT